MVRSIDARPFMRAGLIAGALAAVAMELAQLVARIGAGVPMFPDLLEDLATSVIPAPIFARVLDTLYFAAKPLLYFGLFLVQIGVGALLGAIYASEWGRTGRQNLTSYTSWLGAIIVAVVAWLVTGSILLPLSGHGLFGANVPAGALPFNLSLLSSFFVYAVVLAGLYRRFAPAEVDASFVESKPSEPVTADGLERRRFMRGLAAGAVAVLGSTVAYRVLGQAPVVDTVTADALPTPAGVVTGLSSPIDTATAVPVAAPGATTVASAIANPAVTSVASTSAGASYVAVPGQPTPAIVTMPAAAPPAVPTPATAAEWAIKGLAPEVTATADFYKVSKNFFSDPDVDPARWTLQVTGLVKQGFTITYNKLLTMPVIERYQTLCCISNDVGGDLIGNALWRGVPLRDLLAAAQPAATVKKVVFTAQDGYQDSITLDRAMLPINLLAHTMNGQPLIAGHGMPARLLIPGIYGMKNVKWLTKIELVAENFQGYWQTRGWSDEAYIHTMSRIDVPGDGTSVKAGPVDLAGVAFGGDKGISRVEVSVDAGKTWSDAILKEATGAFTWRLWHFKLPQAQIGSVHAVVRATNGLGEVQPAAVTDSLPDGVTGWHNVAFQVT